MPSSSSAENVRWLTTALVRRRSDSRWRKPISAGKPTRPSTCGPAMGTAVQAFSAQSHCTRRLQPASGMSTAQFHTRGAMEARPEHIAHRSVMPRRR
eukprot:9001837-Pyramimonas_sp.AAC.2